MWPEGNEEFVSRTRAFRGLGELIRVFRVFMIAADRIEVVKIRIA